MTRPFFDFVYSRIMLNEVFGNGGRHERDVKLQLMVFLYYLSLSGAGAKFSSVAKFFHISKGCARMCFRRVLTSILSLKDEFYFWPDNDARNELSNKFLVTHGFPGCVGCIDGTLFNLSTRPSLMGQNFFTRKSCYAIHGLIVCDSECRINYICTRKIADV